MSFRSIMDDGQGNILIGHANYGFSIWNPKTKRIENFVHNPNDIESLPGNNIRDIFIDRYKNIWLGTDYGLALYNPVKKTFLTLTRDVSKPHYTDANSVFSITETKDGILWIGSDVGGVSTLDLRDLSLSNPDRFKFSIMPVSGSHNGLSSQNVRKIFQDSFGNIWIGNYSEGLDFISHIQPEFKRLPYTGVKENRIIEKPVWSVYTDVDGNLWVGGENEIAMFNDGEIKKIYKLDSGIGRIYALHRVGNSILFSAYEKGIFVIDIASGNVGRISTPQERNYANCFVETSDKRVFMGMQDGLYEYFAGGIKKNESLSAAISHLTPNGIMVDRKENLWVGTYGDGVFIFDNHGKEVHHLDDAHGLASNAVKQIYSDSRGWVWIAGQDGLSLIKDISNPLSIINYNYDSGLNDIHIRALLEDSEGNVWFSTNNGLSKWDCETSQLSNYDYNDGIPHSNFTDRAASITPDRNLHFGSLNGICYFNPQKFSPQDENIPVRIVECQSIITPKDNGNAINNGDGIVRLPYDMNSVRISFSVPDYARNRAVEYSYMVEGLDNEWIMSGREHEATLHNLPPSSYIFKVRARLHNQNWSDTNIQSIKIVVTPPLWLAWYAKVFYVLVVVLIIYLIIRFYKHRLKLKGSLEMERRKSIDEQQLNNERLRFYTNVTHELRTPLTLILGPLEDLVADKQVPNTYKGKIKTIHSSALRLLDLINQILEFRKTETQNRRLAVSKGHISSIVTEIGLRYKELNHNDKVAINLNIDDGIPDIFFDSDVIHTILNNLLSNAVKYTPEGSIDLGLKVVDVNGEGLVEISVADTGYGIDAKALPHIFDRYYQAEGKHQASGTGIGLALVRSLSELHQGFLTVESKVGKGTIFIFRLKIDNTYPNALHKDTPQIIGNAEESDIQEEQADKSPVVLVIEDNNDIREYIISSLQPRYNVLSASNGKEGLDIARKNIPDLIISDIMMPVMDGIELCKIIKKDINTSHIPVILLTAKDSIQDKEEGYEVGADSYITKPFSAKLLINRIHNIFESRKLLASILSAHVNGSQSETIISADKDGREVGPVLKLSKLDEEFIQKFTRIVEDNINMSGLDMKYMQDALNMSHSTLYRKIKSLTGMSGNEFIRKIRLKRGYGLLKDGCNVSEAAYSCGFNDVGYFRNCFKDEYGMSPSQFLKQNSSRL